MSRNSSDTFAFLSDDWIEPIFMAANKYLGDVGMDKYINTDNKKLTIKRALIHLDSKGMQINVSDRGDISISFDRAFGKRGKIRVDWTKQHIGRLINHVALDNWDLLCTKKGRTDLMIESDELLLHSHILKVETKTLEDWMPKNKPNFPQGADYYEILNNNSGSFLNRITCTIIAKSEYYRVGFKFIEKNGNIFGDTTIISIGDKNLLIHTGKMSISNLSRKDLIVVLAVNGIRVTNPDKFTGIIIPRNKTYNCELRIVDINVLHFLINNKKVFETLIDKKLLNKIFLFAWADHNDYDLTVKDISIEILTTEN